MSLRWRLAMLGFLASYVPALLLFGVVLVTEREVTTSDLDGVIATSDGSTNRSPWVTWTVLALGPAAAALAWWWAGRAVGPIERVRSVADGIEAADLQRRIGLTRGPTETVALAASFDAMLDRLEQAASIQRRLIEEASHELRTPLSVLATNADVLLAHPDPTPEVYRQGLERSRKAIGRLRTTIDELLVDARGRARTIDRQPADLLAIVQAIVEEARIPAAAKEITLTVSGTPVVCRVDAPTVHRAVANLIDNAISYAPSASSVEVDVATTGSEARIMVTDHGPGIPAEAQEHIFEPFWRARRDVPGTGLGLPIARHIAIAHGGTLTVATPTPSGDGTTFCLTLRR